MTAPAAPPRGARAEAPWTDSHAHLQDLYLAGERGPGPAAEGAAAEGAGAEGAAAIAEGPAPSDAAGVADARLAGVLARARDAGVGTVVCVGTGPQTSAHALALAARSARGELDALVPGAPAIWATAGLHPHDASEGTGETLALLESYAAQAPRTASRLVAVGECGLDYHYDNSPRDVQRLAFAEQVAAARRLGLALVIHARDAWDDIFGVLRAEGVPDRTVLHCFTGGPAEARRCLDAGMYVSFSGIATFKSAPEVREAAALCPLDRLLVETDSPFLAPVPHRGRPNEPAYVPIVGTAVAAVKGVDPSELAASSSAAARAAFAW